MSAVVKCKQLIKKVYLGKSLFFYLFISFFFLFLFSPIGALSYSFSNSFIPLASLLSIFYSKIEHFIITYVSPMYITTRLHFTGPFENTMYFSRQKIKTELLRMRWASENKERHTFAVGRHFL